MKIKKPVRISIIIIAFLIATLGVAKLAEQIPAWKSSSLASGSLTGVFRVMNRLVSHFVPPDSCPPEYPDCNTAPPGGDDWNDDFHDPGGGYYAPDDGSFQDKGGEFAGDPAEDRKKMGACGGHDEMGAKEAMYDTFFPNPGVQLYMDCTRQLIYMMPEMVKMSACMATMLSSGTRGTFTHQLVFPKPPSFETANFENDGTMDSTHFDPSGWEMETMTMKLVIEDHVGSVYGQATHTKVSFYIGFSDNPAALTEPQVVWMYGDYVGLFIKSGRDPMSPVSESIVYKYQSNYTAADADVQNTYGITGQIQRANVLLTIQTGNAAFADGGGGPGTDTFAHFQDMTWEIDSVLGQKQADGSAFTHMSCSMKDGMGVRQVAGIGNRNGEMTLVFNESYFSPDGVVFTGFQGKKIMKVNWGDSGVRSDAGTFNHEENFHRPHFEIQDENMTEGEIPPDHHADKFHFRPPDHFDDAGAKIFNDDGGYSAIPPEKMDEMMGDEHFFDHSNTFGDTY